MKLFLLSLFVGLSCAVYVSFEDQKCFEVLGATLKDSPATIKAKYRQLALQQHPDRVRSASNVPSTGASMEEINDAYECVTHFMGRAEEPSLSKRAETVAGTALDLWESTPEARREELVAQANEYLSSEDVMYDVSYLVGKLFLNNEPDALRRLLALLVCGFLLNIVLCTVGTFTLLYIAYRLVWWVLKYVWWVAVVVLKRVFGGLMGTGKAKEE